jgi:hypothetical protein
VDHDRRVVAFVGTSRLALAYSAEAFAKTEPSVRAVQLAINGVQSVGVLEDLANDPDFQGIAVVDIIEWDVTWGDLYHDAKPYVDRAHALWRVPGAWVNRVLASLAQSQLAILAVGGRELITSLVAKRQWPLPTWVAGQRDRTQHGDYSVAEPAALRHKAESRLTNFVEASPPPEVWLERARALETFVERIRSHGGDVVIVRLPVSGRLAAMFEEHYPRRLYWDALAARTKAHVIDFRDLPGMADVVCPDEMHIDQKDQPAVTNALAAALRKAGVLR